MIGISKIRLSVLSNIFNFTAFFGIILENANDSNIMICLNSPYSDGVGNSRRGVGEYFFSIF